MVGCVLGTCSHGTTNVGYFLGLGTTLSGSLTAPALLTPIPTMLSLGWFHRFSSVLIGALNLCRLICQDFSAPQGSGGLRRLLAEGRMTYIYSEGNKQKQKINSDSTNSNKMNVCIKKPHLHNNF